ncbi:MAG: hypothetical protein ACYDDF_00885 [Thermoplasmatota archaeon]
MPYSVPFEVSASDGPVSDCYSLVPQDRSPFALYYPFLHETYTFCKSVAFPVSFTTEFRGSEANFTLVNVTATGNTFVFGDTKPSILWNASVASDGFALAPQWPQEPRTDPRNFTAAEAFAFAKNNDSGFAAFVRDHPEEILRDSAESNSGATDIGALVPEAPVPLGTVSVIRSFDFGAPGTTQAYHLVMEKDSFPVAGAQFTVLESSPLRANVSLPDSTKWPQLTIPKAISMAQAIAGSPYKLYGFYAETSVVGGAAPFAGYQDRWQETIPIGPGPGTQTFDYAVTLDSRTGAVLWASISPSRANQIFPAPPGNG